MTRVIRASRNCSPADLDDPRFLDRAYRLLLGRPVDHEGLHHYQSLLPRAGRLYVLAKLLCSGEARDYLARHNVTVPHRGPLTLPLRIAGRLGPLGRALRALLRPLYRLAAILARPRLRLRGRLSQLEARSARRDALLHDVLLELDGELTQQNERHGERLGRLERHDERHGERLDELEQRGDRHQQSLDQLEQQGAQHAHRLGEQERTLPAYWSALQHHRRAVQRLLDSPETVARPTKASSRRSTSSYSMPTTWPSKTPAAAARRRFASTCCAISPSSTPPAWRASRPWTWAAAGANG